MSVKSIFVKILIESPALMTLFTIPGLTFLTSNSTQMLQSYT